MIGLNEPAGLVPAQPPSPAPALTAKIFSEDGWLCDALELEHRPQQAQMARAVAAAMKTDEPLLFEAGTGVGKSLAYLLPGLIHAMSQTRQMIVSTHTISLQEQLETKDLPLCRKFFSAVDELKPYAAFKSAVLVGKSNYLCTTRLAYALADRATLFSDDDYAELQRIAAWAETSATGLRFELNPPPRAEVWETISADSSSCSRKHCNGEKCFYQRARTRLRSAHVIIVNHALLFALINAGGAQAQGAGSTTRGLLFPDDFVVIDEAHTIPEVATQNFGLSLSSYGVDRALKLLFNPKNKRGLLRKEGGAEAQQLVLDALDASRQFFDFISTTLLAQQSIVRLREQDAAEPMLDGPLTALHKIISKLADRLDEGRDRDELLDQAGRIKSLRAGFNEWLALSDPAHVYWAERTGRRQTIITLRSAPIDVAPALREHLFGCRTSIVCTSATLALSGRIETYAQRIGADDAHAVVEASPFDFERNMRVYVAADIPLPSPKDARLSLDSLVDWLRFCTLRVSGGTLVLFTSYNDLRHCAAALGEDFSAVGRPLLVQGEDLSRTEMTTRMRDLGNAILFGTDSFWTGVDVPGNSLAQVIITRLPFDPPTHPILEARAEHIRDRGGNPFNELTLPDALIKFRQGVGRLIRTANDRGLITILDSRVLAKTYGRLFLDSLPTPHWASLTCDTREARFLPFS